MNQIPHSTPEKLSSVPGILKNKCGYLCVPGQTKILQMISTLTKRLLIPHLSSLMFSHSSGLDRFIVTSHTWSWPVGRKLMMLLPTLISYKQVMRSIRDNITEEVLLNEIYEIIRLPMYADRIRSDSKAAQQHANSVRRRWWKVRSNSVFERRTDRPSTCSCKSVERVVLNLKPSLLQACH